MDAAQWAKDVRNRGSYNDQVQEKKVKPIDEQALNCPRCNSTNTKFCYYNNYSLTQPRYFCKACKRYWTKGGSLRSVPVGGGSRKNKRSASSIPSMSSSSQNLTTRNGQDLNLGSQGEYHHGFSQFLKLPKIENRNTNFLSSSLSTCDGLNYVSTTNVINPTNDNTVFKGTRFNNLQEFEPNIGFPFQGNGIKYGNFHGNQEGGERIMLPFGVLNQQHSSKESGQSMGNGNSTTGYWNETMGGGSSTLFN